MRVITDQDTYHQLKTRLVIDPLRLTEELLELPQYLSDATEAVAECQRIRDEAKDALDIIEANVSARIRYDEIHPKMPSEERIKSERLIDLDVQTAMEVLRDADYNLNLWKSLADGMRSKSYAISKIADLIQSGYTTPDTIYSNRKKEYAQRGVT